jgi:hypothetical protein
MNLKIDGISTSEHVDSSGELLIIENHDISDLVEGRGVLNFEHSNKAEDIVGAVIYAKKILKKEDCENDRQRKYWDFSKKPFVYIIGELWEDQEHPGALAVAAMIRYYHKKGEKMLVGFSIEGATLEREDYVLKESVGRRVAITLRSCNKMAIAGLLEDPKEKSVAKSIKKMENSLAEAITALDLDSVMLDEVSMPKDPVMDLHKAIEDLNKTLTAGMGNVAPSQLTGGAALTRESISGFNRNRLKAAVRDWDKKRPLKETVKAALPEVSDQYIDHFVDLAEELSLKKNQTTKLVRIGSSHSPNIHANEAQKALIEGLYFDPKKEPKTFRPGHDLFRSALYKVRNDAGKDVLVKNPEQTEGYNMENALSATHYYHLANKVFGMGDHVPVTNYFKHDALRPEYSAPHEIHHQAMEIIPKAKTPLIHGDEWNKALDKSLNDGSLHKLMMMDSILGNQDRHVGNVIIHPKGHIMSVDNDNAFDYKLDAHLLPEYLEEADQASLHPHAAKWIQSINPKSLAGEMSRLGHSPDNIQAAVRRLRMFQKGSQKPVNANELWYNVMDPQGVHRDKL